MVFETGNIAGSGNSGNINIETGSVNTGTRGNIALNAEFISHTASFVQNQGTFVLAESIASSTDWLEMVSDDTANESSIITAFTGPSTNSHALVLGTGDTTTGNSGNVIIKSGEATSGGNSGNIEITAGQSTSGTEGDVLVAGKKVVLDSSELFTITNNQTSATSLTGIVFDKLDVKAVKLLINVERSTDTVAEQLNETGEIWLSYSAKKDTWSIFLQSFGDDAGVTFTVTSGGQLQYTSTNLAGANYAGNLRISTVQVIAQ